MKVTMKRVNSKQGQYQFKKLLLEAQMHMEQATTAFTSLGLTLDIERSTLTGPITHQEIDLSDDEIDVMSSSSDLEDY